MKKKQKNITDLNFDILKHIISFVAKSSNGAINFARTISVCKAFMELAEDEDILKAVVFDNVSVSRSDRSFWQINGLLIKCAHAGNLIACHLVFEDLKEKIESLRVKRRAIGSAKQIFLVRMEAVRGVRTRARVRAAESAGKECLEMFHDVEIEADAICKEVSEKLERMKHAVIAQKW